jgi:DNA polymerase-1
MTKIALVYLRSALRGYNARVVNTVHDEIVVEVIAEQAEEVKKIVEHEMIRAGEQILQTVPVVADAAIGDYWKK